VEEESDVNAKVHLIGRVVVTHLLRVGEGLQSSSQPFDVIFFHIGMHD